MSPNDLRKISNFRRFILGRSQPVTFCRFTLSDELPQPDKEKLLIAIMQRIIDNDGTKLIL